MIGRAEVFNTKNKLSHFHAHQQRRFARPCLRSCLGGPTRDSNLPADLKCLTPQLDFFAPVRTTPPGKNHLLAFSRNFMKRKRKSHPYTGWELRSYLLSLLSKQSMSRKRQKIALGRKLFKLKLYFISCHHYVLFNTVCRDSCCSLKS